MGWKTATGLGRLVCFCSACQLDHTGKARLTSKRSARFRRNGQGIIDPVRIGEQYGTLGLGKASEYEERASEATETRKATQAELIAFEDEAGKRRREEEVARQEGIKEALKKETSMFFCECCNKQYVKITEWENHLR